MVGGRSRPVVILPGPQGCLVQNLVGDITVELYTRTTLAVIGRLALYLRILKVLGSCIPVPSLVQIDTCLREL